MTIKNAPHCWGALSLYSVFRHKNSGQRSNYMEHRPPNDWFFDFRGQKHKSALSVTIDYHFLVWQIHETFPILCANFFYKNRHFSQGTKFISCVYRRSTKSSYRLLSTTNLPKVYQKTWFFMILESCCNSVFFNFWYSKSSKNRAQKGTKDHKRN